MGDFFKGYVPSRNKKCLVPFKGKTAAELNTYEQVKNLKEYAGVLAEDAVLVDIDDYDQSEILMDIVEDIQLACRVYETDRGKHFLFKNSGIEKCVSCKVVACGLQADFKIGKNTSYEVLKMEWKPREIIYDIYEGEDYDVIPKWLYPVKTRMAFMDMKAGDGRNDSLFRYILTLQTTDFTVDECRECIRIMNKYVLKEPLEESELDIILRDEAFQKPVFFKKNVFMFNEFANYLRNNRHIVKINNNLHIYNDGIYMAGGERIESVMIGLIPTLSRRQRKEVLDYLSVLITENLRPSSANYIAFRNGVYNIIDGSFGEFSDKYIITNRIPHDYIPDAYSELCDKTIMKLACGDKVLKDIIEEMIGYCFYRSCAELRKCFVLTGEKRNGKSTLLEMINHLLGDENISALDVKELNDRFKTSELVSKLANIGDDISDEFITNPAVFKKLVSGNKVNVEKKGQNPFDFNNYAKLLFSSNSMPRIKDKTGAVLDRMLIIPFNATFSVGDPDHDPFIKHKLKEEEVMSHLINVGLAGLKRVLVNRSFTKSERVEQEIAEYNEINNPILTFFKELGEGGIANELTKDVYCKYQTFCIANGLQPVSHIEFSKQAKAYFSVDIKTKKLDGKSYKVFFK